MNCIRKGGALWSLMLDGRIHYLKAVIIEVKGFSYKVDIYYVYPDDTVHLITEKTVQIGESLDGWYRFDGKWWACNKCDALKQRFEEIDRRLKACKEMYAMDKKDYNRVKRFLFRNNICGGGDE